MARRKPFTQSDIDERERWPEIQAGLRGPEAYEELGILKPTQRRKLIQLARVTPEQEKPFVDEVTFLISSYRLRKRHDAQESPAAVTESMRRVIHVVEDYSHAISKMPVYVLTELEPPLPPPDWFKHAKEKLRQEEQWMIGHRPKVITEALIKHAWTLQKVAGAHSSYLASNWIAMKRWLEEALLASEEPPVGKNAKKAYFDEIMLPRAENGSVNLSGTPKGLAVASPGKGT